MLEGLWRINPNLIENIQYYVSVMPPKYRRELLDVYINDPMDSKFNYNTWKEINFDKNYSVRTTDIDIIDWSKYRGLGGIRDVDLRETNRYYFLLFFFNAFKRRPEKEVRINVEEWIARCLVDVLAKDPSITPYYPAIRKWRGSRNFWQLPYKTLVTLSQINGLGIWYIESDEGDERGEFRIKTNIRDLMNHRKSSENLGLTQTANSGIYDLFISDCFDLSDVSSESINSHYIKATYIDKEAYYYDGEGLKKDEFKGYGLTNSKLDRSFDLFKEYWREFGYLIPIGFLSKNNDSFRFMNYSIKSFENLK